SRRRSRLETLRRCESAVADIGAYTAGQTHYTRRANPDSGDDVRLRTGGSGGGPRFIGGRSQFVYLRFPFAPAGIGRLENGAHTSAIGYFGPSVAKPGYGGIPDRPL